MNGASLSLSTLLAILLTHGLSAQSPSADWQTELRPFVKRWCAECHSDDEPEADLDLVAFVDAPGDDLLDSLLELRDVIDGREMPPSDADQPPPEDAARVVGALQSAIDSQDVGYAVRDVTLRRLSRFEYATTVRDLLGVTIDVSDFPMDDLGYGFDNIGDAMSTSALHLEKYAAAAADALLLAMPDLADSSTRRLEAEDMRSRIDASRGDLAALYTSADVHERIRLPRPGRYRIRVRAFGQQAGPDPARMVVRLGEQRLKTFDVKATSKRPRIYEVVATTSELDPVVAAEFINDYYRPDAKDRSQRDRNLFVDWIDVEGPLDPSEPTWAHSWVLGDRPQTASIGRTRVALLRFARRAWRRPVLRREISPFIRLYSSARREGDGHMAALRLALQAMLVSPHFLFRIEPRGDEGELDDHALATRLSYFLWSSQPDDTLRERADRGELTDPEQLLSEARRMLSDRRSKALSHNFASQWLELRRLGEVMPDPDRFRWDDELARAMRKETELMFDLVLRRKLPVRTLIDVDFTFLNERLAKHYGIQGVTGPQFRRVKLADRRRGGILTHASVLTITSNPTRTSPVKRGLWVLENIVGDPPPPPEPGTDAFAAGEDAVATAAGLREQLAVHRRDARCAVCHDRMDALGLAMENFDPIGGWRDADGGQPIDASGELPGGVRLSGPEDLRAIMSKSPSFPVTLMRKLFVYAVGRDVTADDRVAIERDVATLGSEPTLHDLILAVVASDAFRRRR